MAYGRGTTHDVDLFRVDTEFLDAVQGHNAEGLIDLPKIDVSGLNASLLKRHPARRHGASPHDGGIYAREADGTDGGQGFDALRFSGVLGHEDH